MVDAWELIRPIDAVPLPGRIDLNQSVPGNSAVRSEMRNGWETPGTHIIQWIIATAPEIFLLLAIAIGTALGRQKFFGFSIGTTACILIASVILGQLGTFTIPALHKTVLFSLFVF